MDPTHTITQRTVGLSADRPVRVHPYRCRDDVEITPHDHDYFEIGLVVAGVGEHVTPTSAGPIGRGSLMVVWPTAVHGFTASRGLEILNIYYLAEWLMDDLPALWGQPGLVSVFLAPALFGRAATLRIPECRLDEAELAECLREVEDLMRAGGPADRSPLFARAAFLKLLVLLSEAFQRRNPVDTQAFRPEVWLALERVEECLAQSEAFQVGDVAAETGLSADHFSRVFREATGRTPMEYFQRRRVHRAGRMLLEPGQDVTQVAHHLGFCDAAHFSKVFKRHMGCSPRAYRSRYARTA